MNGNNDGKRPQQPGKPQPGQQQQPQKPGQQPQRPGQQPQKPGQPTQDDKKRKPW